MQWARTFAALTVLIASLEAQAHPFTVTIDDPVHGGLELATVADGIEIDVLVTRRWLTPSARQSLATREELRSMRTTSPGASGPAILSRLPLSGIPGDRRLRAEIGDVAISVLGVGASAEESVRQAHEESFPRGILVGVDSAATPPNGWLRVNPLSATRPIWARGVRVQDARVPRESANSEPSILVVTRSPLEVTPPQTAPEPTQAPSADATTRDEPPAPQTKSATTTPRETQLGPFPEHLQGIARDPMGCLYWSWTDQLVKTDSAHREISRVAVESHHGDLTWNAGRVVVAVNLGRFNDPLERHDSWAYVYRDDTLTLEAKHRLPQCRYGAGGICWDGTHYVVVTGLPVELREQADAANEVHLLDAEFRFLRTVRIAGGWTRLGIQTAEFAYGRFLFGCYGAPRSVLVASPDLLHVERYDGVDAAYGIAETTGGDVLVATGSRDVAGHRATLRQVHVGLPWH
ncbi:MAG: hypothetical protein AB7I19_01270 [Planctomycetota bacterium]